MSKDEQKVMEPIRTQNESIDYLVLSGGGVKGAIYPGVCKAIIDRGLMNGLKAIAGSSAGAMSAAFIATGIKAEEFEKISKETNFKDLFGTEGISIGPVPINKDGRPLYQLLDNTIRKNVNDFLKSANIKEICKKRLATLESEKAELNKQQEALGPRPFTELNNDLAENVNINLTELELTQEKINKIIENDYKDFTVLAEKCNNKDKITFRDLALLRAVEPTKFKDLYITAVRQDNAELTIFSAENTPDVSIALACRASASLPIVFQPAVINGIGYLDGGYMDNVPTKHFEKNEVEEKDTELDVQPLKNAEEIRQAKKKGRVLVMAFGSGSEASANLAIYSCKKFNTPGAFIKFVKDVLIKFLARVGGSHEYTKTELATADSLRKDNSLNTVVLDTKGVGTLSFTAAKKYEEYLGVKGYIQTTEHFDNQGLGTKCSSALSYQKFALEVFECYDQANLNKSVIRQLFDVAISSMIPSINKQQEPKAQGHQERLNIKSHDEKADALLSFAKEDKWQKATEKLQGASSNCKPVENILVVLKDLVVIAATQRSINGIGRSADTKSIDAIIKTLNSSTAAFKVKKQFMDLLGVDKVQDPRLTQVNKDHKTEIAEFKFTAKDFTKLIAETKYYTPASVNKNIGRAI